MSAYELDALIIGNTVAGVAGATLVGHFYSGGTVTQALTRLDGPLGASIGVFASATMTNNMAVNMAAGMAIPFLMGNRNIPELLLLPAGYLGAQWVYSYALNYMFNKGK